jgi:hypothetical protein
MKRSYWIIGGLAVVGVAVTATALWEPNVEKGEPIAGLHDPSELVLYSIDGTENREAKYRQAITNGEEVLQQYAVLGKVVIEDEADRRELVATLQDAVVNHDGMIAECFLPRHAVVAIAGGKRFEIIICFECNSYEISGTPIGGMISRRAETSFNDILTRAGIPIAP